MFRLCWDFGGFVMKSSFNWKVVGIWKSFMCFNFLQLEILIIFVCVCVCVLVLGLKMHKLNFHQIRPTDTFYVEFSRHEKNRINHTN